MASQPNSPKSGFDLSAYAALYLSEARKCLSALRENLLRLQAVPADRAALFEAQRSAHTLKGMSATMRYGTLTALAAALEAPLRRANQARQLLGSRQIDALLAECDGFETHLERLAAGHGMEEDHE